MPRLTDDAYRRSVLRRIEEDVLRETCNRYERLILLGADGTPLLVKDGPQDGVELSAQEVQRWRGAVDLVTHNHPAALSFTVSDLLAALALGVRELNAFGPTVRYRLIQKAGGTWPRRGAAQTAIEQIEARIRAVIEPRLAAEIITPAAALALHRHTRWTLFAQRFAAGVDYVVEDR